MGRLLAVPGLVLLFAVRVAAVDWVVNPSNGHSYAVVPAVQWADGEAQAIALGGHLATIRSASENAWIVQSILDRDVGFAWIGLYQLPGSLEPANGWVWASGEPVTFTNWYGGEPNNLEGGEDWAELYDSSFDGCWNDDAPGHWGQPSVGIVEVVPEPSSILALLCGIGGLAIRRRRRYVVASHPCSCALASASFAKHSQLFDFQPACSGVLAEVEAYVTGAD